MRTTSSIRRLPVLAACLAALALPASALAAIDTFLKLDGIEGESADARHKGAIDVYSWSFGIGPGAAPSNSARAPTPKPCLTELALTKMVDKATPPILAAAMLGSVIPTATMSMRKAGESPTDFLTFTMTQVLVSSVSEGGSSGAGTPYEQVTLRFSTIKVSYRPQKDDGSFGPPVETTLSGSC